MLKNFFHLFGINKVDLSADLRYNIIQFRGKSVF